MVCKALLTFVVVGALSANVWAIPVPQGERYPGDSPDSGTPPSVYLASPSPPDSIDPIHRIHEWGKDVKSDAEVHLVNKWAKDGSLYVSSLSSQPLLSNQPDRFALSSSQEDGSPSYY